MSHIANLQKGLRKNMEKLLKNLLICLFSAIAKGLIIMYHLLFALNDNGFIKVV